MSAFGRKSPSGKVISSFGIGNDFTNGRRGMARAVRGAKKYVNTRCRFHEKQQIRNQDWEKM